MNPVHLHVLAGRQIQKVVAEVGVGDRAVGEVNRYLADDPRLFGSQHAAGDLYADHERVPTLLLRVYADPLEPLYLARHLTHRGEVLGVTLDDRLAHLQRVTLQLDPLYLVELLVLPKRFHVRSSHRTQCRPHSVFSIPAQRPARGSSSGATGRVWGSHPMLL
jgi:hypothetical protein